MTDISTSVCKSTTVEARDCDGDAATIEITFSPADFGADIELLVTAWGQTTAAYLTAEQAETLRVGLTHAIGYATAIPDDH